MNKNMPIMVGVVVAILIVGGYFIYKSMGPASQAPAVVTETTPSTETTSSTDAATVAGTTKEFTINGSSFKFDPATLTVSKGDTVKVTFKNSGGMHDFQIEEFNARTKILQSGESETIEFVANQVGTFEYFCSVGNHRAMGMKGNLIVN